MGSGDIMEVPTSSATLDSFSEFAISFDENARTLFAAGDGNRHFGQRGRTGRGDDRWLRLRRALSRSTVTR